jgi:hypothetical protein
MDYFVISSDYPELKEVVQKIFLDIDTVNVISSTDCVETRRSPRGNHNFCIHSNIN